MSDRQQTESRPAAAEDRSDRRDSTSDTFTREKALKTCSSHFKRPIPRLPPGSDSPHVASDYTLKWPRTGKSQSAFGILGHDYYVRRGLPALSGFASERLNFEVCLYPDSGECQGGTIMDEAWKSLAQRDGLRARVTVEDSPEERVMSAAREETLGKMVASVVGVAEGVPLIYGLVTLARNLSSSR